MRKRRMFRDLIDYRATQTRSYKRAVKAAIVAEEEKILEEERRVHKAWVKAMVAVKFL